MSPLSNFSRVPSYSHIRVFGCLCFSLFPSTTINKLHARSTPCIFLGYPDNHRGYKCFDLSLNKIITCRHVLFDETDFPFAKVHQSCPHTYDCLGDVVSPYFLHWYHTTTSHCLSCGTASGPLSLSCNPFSSFSGQLSSGPFSSFYVPTFVPTFSWAQFGTSTTRKLTVFFPIHYISS